MTKSIVLIFVGYYFPGYKSGGPIRSIVNLVEQLGDEFSFKIVTRDRDKGDIAPYKNIIVNEWQSVGKASVFFLAPQQANYFYFKKLLEKTTFDILYLNSLFDFRFTLQPLIVRYLHSWFRPPVILAPRGELSLGALRCKKNKKRCYLFLVRFLRLYQGIVWQASSEFEQEDICRRFVPKPQRVMIASDLASIVHENRLDLEYLPPHKMNALRVVFLSRIAPMKNLHFALNVLLQMKVHVMFDIYGPIEDVSYWNACQKAINQMTKYVSVHYRGCVPYDQVVSCLSHYDLFFLPSCGENYGHVIAESLMAGTPVLISDRTPWRNLVAKGIGWDYSLSYDLAFVECIEAFSMQTEQARQMMRSQIKKFIAAEARASTHVENNRQLFLSQLQG